MPLFPDQANINVVPQAPQIDPRLLAPNPIQNQQAIDNGIEIGGKLARLGQLQDQLALEKTQIKAAGALADYKIQQTDLAAKNLPLQAGADAATATAAKLQSQAAAAQAQGSLSTQTAFNQGPGPLNLAVAQTSQAQGAAASASAGAKTAETFASGPGPAAMGSAQTSQALSGAASAAAAGQPGGSATLDPAQAAYNNQLAGIAASYGIPYDATNPNASLDEIYQLRKLSFLASENGTIVDPNTGDTHAVVNWTSKLNGQLVKQTDLGVTKLGEQQRPALQANAEWNSLLSAKTQVADSLDKLSAFEKKYPQASGAYNFWTKNAVQGVAANQIASSDKGPVSALERIAAAKIASPETQALQTSLTALQASAAKISGDRGSKASGLLPTSSDIATPQQLRTKLTGLTNYLDSQIEILKDSNTVRNTAKGQSAQAQPGIQATQEKEGNAPATPPPQAAQSLQDGAKAYIGGQPMIRATFNGVSGWIPLPGPQMPAVQAPSPQNPG